VDPKRTKSSTKKGKHKESSYLKSSLEDYRLLLRPERSFHRIKKDYRKLLKKKIVVFNKNLGSGHCCNPTW
jgi:hypothetical protein